MFVLRSDRLIATVLPVQQEDIGRFNVDCSKSISKLILILNLATLPSLIWQILYTRWHMIPRMSCVYVELRILYAINLYALFVTGYLSSYRYNV